MRFLRFLLQFPKTDSSTSPAAAPSDGGKFLKQDRQRVLTCSSLLSVVWATVLIDTLILTMVSVTVWATGSYLHLSIIPFALLALSSAIATVWACVTVAVLAYDAETAPENNAPAAASWKQSLSVDADLETTGA